MRVCGHRFCAECIEKALRLSKLECPVCRTKLPSRRELSADGAFDLLVAAVYGDVAGFEAAEEAELNARGGGLAAEPLQGALDAPPPALN